MGAIIAINKITLIIIKHIKLDPYSHSANDLTCDTSPLLNIFLYSRLGSVIILTSCLNSENIFHWG